jgi:hypothetical protein
MKPVNVKEYFWNNGTSFRGHFCVITRHIINQKHRVAGRRALASNLEPVNVKE